MVLLPTQVRRPTHHGVRLRLRPLGPKAAVGPAEGAWAVLPQPLGIIFLQLGRHCYMLLLLCGFRRQLLPCWACGTQRRRADRRAGRRRRGRRRSCRRGRGDRRRPAMRLLIYVYAEAGHDATGRRCRTCAGAPEAGRWGSALWLGAIAGAVCFLGVQV